MRTLTRLNRRNKLRPLERWIEHGLGRRHRRRLWRFHSGALRGLCFLRTLQSLFALTGTTLFLFTRGLFGGTLRLFLPLLPCGLFFNTAARVGFQALALETLGFDTLGFALYGLL